MPGLPEKQTVGSWRGFSNCKKFANEQGIAERGLELSSTTNVGTFRDVAKPFMFWFQTSLEKRKITIWTNPGFIPNGPQRHPIVSQEFWRRERAGFFLGASVDELFVMDLGGSHFTFGCAIHFDAVSLFQSDIRATLLRGIHSFRACECPRKVRGPPEIVGD